MGNTYGPSFALINGANGLDVGTTNPLAILLSDGSSAIPQTNQVSTTDLLASASRAATTNSADVTNNYYRGIVVEVPVASASSSGTLTVTLQGKLPSGAYYTILASTAYTTGVAGSSIILRVFPGISNASTGDVTAGAILPYTWRVLLTHATTGAMNYAVHYQLLK